jgi:hypothetical protein
MRIETTPGKPIAGILTSRVKVMTNASPTIKVKPMTLPQETIPDHPPLTVDLIRKAPRIVKRNLETVADLREQYLQGRP